jgi:SagB-type dehydrogenase family enzyme
VYERCSIKYGKRAVRYCHIEAGCIAENIHLQAESLNLSTVIIGAFYDQQVQQALGLEKSYRPLIVMPTGLRR